MKPNWPVRGLFVVVLALVATGCGGSKADSAGGAKAADGKVTTTTAPSSGAEEGGGKGGKGTNAAKDADSSATTAPTTPPTTDPTAPLASPGPKGQLDLAVSLAETCVRPGGTQAITIRTKPKAGVGYDTAYADGKTGMMEGHYGGNFGGQADEDGTWGDRWVVAPNAPPGRAEVRVLASHLDYGGAQTTVYFTVADVTGACS